MKKLWIAIALMLGVSFVGSSRVAQAQFYTPYPRYSNNIFVNSNLNLFFQKRSQIARFRAQGKHEVADAMEGISPSADPSETPVVAIPLSATSFTPVTNQLMPEALAAQGGEMSVAERAQLTELYRQLLLSYEDLIEESQEERLKNNVAGAMMFLIQASYYVLEDGAELTEEQQESLLQEINAALAQDSQFSQTDPQYRQQMYETAVITGGFILALAQENDPEFHQQAQQLATEMLGQITGVSAEEMKSLFEAS